MLKVLEFLKKVKIQKKLNKSATFFDLPPYNYKTIKI